MGYSTGYHRMNQATYRLFRWYIVRKIIILTTPPQVIPIALTDYAHRIGWLLTEYYRFIEYPDVIRRWISMGYSWLLLTLQITYHPVWQQNLDSLILAQPSLAADWWSSVNGQAVRWDGWPIPDRRQVTTWRDFRVPTIYFPEKNFYNDKSDIRSRNSMSRH